MEINKRKHEIDTNANFVYDGKNDKKIKIGELDGCNHTVAISSVSNEMVRRIISYVEPRFHVSLTCRQFLVLANLCGNDLLLDLEESNDVDHHWAIRRIKSCKEVSESVTHLMILGNSKRAKEIALNAYQNEQLSKGMSIICGL